MLVCLCQPTSWNIREETGEFSEISVFKRKLTITFSYWHESSLERLRSDSTISCTFDTICSSSLSLVMLPKFEVIMCRWSIKRYQGGLVWNVHYAKEREEERKNSQKTHNVSLPFLGDWLPNAAMY